MEASIKTGVPLAIMVDAANGLLDLLGPVTERIEIAGSIRRQKPTPSDIELVCIPIRPVNMFDEVDNTIPTQLDRRLLLWAKEGRVELGKNGPKYKQFSFRLRPDARIQVDLFITTPECWPVIFAIRTGSAEYSHRFVTPWWQDGLLRNGCHVREGRLYDEGQLVELRDERHFFEYVQGGFKEPRER